MRRNADWEDMRLFLAVARAGGLAGAAERTGASPATLGRRVASLEKSLGKRLVEREARGYRLTADGRDLVRRLEDMDQAANAISAWSEGGQMRRPVRISAGDWTTRLLIGHIGEFWSAQAGWMPEFLSDLRDRDVARRQIDIGIRNRRPEQPWLAGVRTGEVHFSVYQTRGESEADAGDGPVPDMGWIGLVEDDARSPTGVWLQETHGHEMALTVNRASLALSLVRQGHGRMLLPEFVGGAFPDLVSLGRIEHLSTERWLVMHQDERHEPAIREALTGLSRLLKRDPLLKAGVLG
ncbi:LysR family transcriptional regulator [Rhodobacterales bacterium]|nr:LysR family transcriptional regulator [Rhodobacterales bacterium]